MPSDLDRSSAVPDPKDPTIRSSVVPRPVAGQTIIVPFDDISDEGPEPIRVARLSPTPGPESPAEEPTVRRALPAAREGRKVTVRNAWAALTSVPAWAWFIGTLALLMLGSIGAVLVVIAAAAYIYLG